MSDDVIRCQHGTPRADYCCWCALLKAVFAPDVAVPQCTGCEECEED